MMNDRDDIRLKGTVEVVCKVCQWSFWVDCLDPRLPAGPFVCPSCKDPGRQAEPKAETIDG